MTEDKEPAPPPPTDQTPVEVPAAPGMPAVEKPEAPADWHGIKGDVKPLKIT